ncbi:MAG: radical SAM protein, partial [Bacillota bacterium]
MDQKLTKCKSCPRQCNIDRSLYKGACGMGGLVKVAKAFLHKWEEPCISGTNGSGTVFFSGCNLRCVYCQNYAISQQHFGKEITPKELSEIYIRLQEMGAHNINLVTPSHFIPQIRESILSAKSLKIPVIYNSNGYDNIDGLKMIEGLVDVFLPDLKYFTDETAVRYSRADNYFEVSSAAVMEMYRQVGTPVFDENGIIKKGLVIRHLILPGLVNESIKILDFIKNNFPDDVYVSLMSQYTPCYKAEDYPEISRRIIRREYERVLNHFFKLGLKNGYIQERDSAKKEYIPDFDLE